MSAAGAAVVSGGAGWVGALLIASWPEGGGWEVAARAWFALGLGTRVD